MCDAGAIGERGRVEFSPAMVVCRASSGADRSWLRSLAAAGPWLRRLAGALPSVSGSSRAGAHGPGGFGLLPPVSRFPRGRRNRAGDMGLFRRLAASLFVAIAASAFGTPALAQAHCDAADPNELLCATMTVAVSGNDTGFRDTAVDMFGMLSDEDFIVASATQRIRALSYNTTTGLLTSIMSPGFSLETFGKLKLTLGSTDFDYDGFQTTSTQVWNNHGLSWSSGDTVAVKLVRVPNTVPTVANTIPDLSAVVGTAFGYTVPADAFNDADGDDLTYSATKIDGNVLPTWLTLAGTAFSGAPMAADVGTVSVKVTVRDGFGGSVSDDFDIAVSRTAQNAPWDIRAESPSGTTGLLRASWRAPTNATGVVGYHVRYRIVGSSGFYYSRVVNRFEFFARYLDPDTTYEGQVCTVTELSGRGWYRDKLGPCSGWSTGVRLPAQSEVSANDFTLSLELPDGSTAKATVAWDRTLRYRIRVSGVYDHSVLEFPSSTFGIAATRLGPPGERIPTFTPYDSNSDSFFTYRGFARKFIVWDSLTSGYWERTQTVWTGHGPNEPHVLELIDEPERFLGTQMNRIGTPSSLCVEITDSSSTVTAPCSDQQVEVDPPIVEGTPRVSEAGVDGRWPEGETVEVTLAFSESVTVDTANGVPSVGIGLGGPTPARSAAWLRGSGTTELVFGYTLVQGDGDHTVMAVAPDSLALNGGAIRSVATGADAALAHVGTLVQARPARAPEGPRARFDSLPEGHDGATAFTVELHFSAAPAGLSAKTDAASVLEVTGGTVTGARQTAEDVNPAWEVTVTPNGLGDVTVRVPVRACIETNAVCIGGQPLSEGATAVVPGTSMTASFTQAPAAHDGSNSFDLHMEFSHEPNSFSYRTVRDALFDLADGRIERVWRRERGKNRLWGITVVPDGQGPVTLTARATTDCTAQYAACNIDGRKFAGNLRLTVPGPHTLPMVSIAPSTSPVTEGAAAAFSLARTGAAAAALTVAVSVSESEAAVSGTPPTSVTFAAGSASATLSVATEDDEATEDASTVTATVLSGSGYTLDVTSMSAGVVVNDDDAAPVVSTTSPVVVAENETPVATLTATDADTAVADLSWSIPVAAPGGADGAKFALTADGALSFKAAKDFEAPDDADADGDYEITVRVTDGANPIDASLVVRLSDVDDAAPVVSTTSPVMVAENVTTVAMLTATDADTAVADLSWSIPVGAPGGADRAKFALTTDGALSFKAAKDFEAPDDADADGDYEITVRVTDGANPVDASLVVRLSDVDDAAPTLSSASVDGAVLTLRFSKALDTASQPAESSFAVAVGGTARTVDAVAVAGKVVTLTLSSVVTSGQIVTVDYTVPTGAGAKPVQDGAGNRAASFANTEVRNLTAAALPEVSIAPAMTPVTEGTAAAFVLRRTGATDDALTVTVTVSEAGSVLSGAPPSSATFAAGLAEARLSVATVNDAVDEADTRVRASVVAGDGYEVDGESASAGVDVFDDDAAAQAAAVELWSTTMTWTDIGNNWFGGFSDAFSNPVWSEDGQDFRIWFISYDAGARALLMMHDGSGGRIAEPGQLALHVGGLTVGPGEAMSEFAGAEYARLGGVGSQWQVGEQVTVRLTRTSDEAASAPAGPGLSVADAQVNEAAGAPLRFRVTLDAPAESVVSVRYGTANGTALAGEDYVAARGAVRFARGEIEKTVEVAVLPDDHDEGSETMTLALSGPYGAAIADGTATGTISNEGAIPKAWIARFGRTVAEQAIEAVEARFEAPRAPGLSGTIGGQSISGIAGPGPEAGEVRGAGTDARQGLEALSDWFGGESGDEDELGIGTRTLSGREVLTGTSLGFTAGTAETGFAAFWGRGAVTSFDGRDGEMTLDGEVASAMVGADFSRDALLGGLMLSHSRGEGGYRSPDDNGEVESTLTALYPYARYALSERVSVWGMVGYGEGTLTVTREGAAPLRTDMDFLMGALGGRGVLLDGGHDGATLAAKSDAFAVRTSTDAVSGLKAAEADVTRVRFALEGSRPFGLGGDAVLTPSLELGVRHDGGDAETGFGADIGAGLVLSDPARGISAEVRARGLLTHEAEGMRERGLSGTLAFDPAPDTERGLSLSLTQSVGAQGEGGVDALLERRTLANLGAEEEDDLSARRLDARIGYGLGILDDRYTATPELGLGLSDRDREIRLGWRMTERVTTGLAFEFGLEGTRREFMGDDAGPEHSLDVGLGWTLQGSRGGDAFSMRLEAARLEVANDDRPPERRIGLEFTARW